MKSELDDMDRKTRKVMTMNNELHSKSDIDRFQICRAKGGRGLIRYKTYRVNEKNSLG